MRPEAATKQAHIGQRTDPDRPTREPDSANSRKPESAHETDAAQAVGFRLPAGQEELMIYMYQQRTSSCETHPTNPTNPTSPSISGKLDGKVRPKLSNPPGEVSPYSQVTCRLVMAASRIRTGMPLTVRMDYC